MKVMKDCHKNEKLFKVANREISIMRILDHPNIIKLHEIYEDEKYLSLVLEYCSGGDLFEYLFERHHLCEEEAAHILHNILTALEYLHCQHICHRDLKLQNFMFDKKGSEAVLKLIDFGLSAQYSSEEGTFKTIVGSPLYIAPEILSKKPYDYTCDTWSVGVIFYLLLAGTPPFLGETNREVFQNICKGNYDIEKGIWQSISSEAKDLLKSFLKVDSKQRITCHAAMKHKWFQKMLVKGKIESPFRGPSDCLITFKGTPDHGIFKNFDKDSLSQFSLEGIKDSPKSQSDKEEKKNNSKISERKSTMKQSKFKKQTDDDEMEIGNESQVINLVHMN